ncbi:hypothetical protein ASPCAL01711 [Aspergillus calidoustus]|uniref:Uncharacterized protein n=1 Tax=Aspergillus calidoustus TaxID=454130 RepID=A0A0U5GKS5_ASPCI|nr:hypothetical protein ASPCAL01711 [Aspergillus calidoustus]
MNTRGLYRNSKAAPTPTNEYIHWTVRKLYDKHPWHCQALKDYPMSFDNFGRASWNLRSKGAETAIRLPEESPCKLEQDLLLSWMKEEMGVEKRNKGENASRSSTTDAETWPLFDILEPYLKSLQQPL